MWSNKPLRTAKTLCKLQVYRKIYCLMANAEECYISMATKNNNC